MSNRFQKKQITKKIKKQKLEILIVGKASQLTEGFRYGKLSEAMRRPWNCIS